MHLKGVGKMKILFYCGHPAHFHLIKNPAKKLLDKGNSITIAIKSKDVLEELVIDSGFKYYKISNITSSARFIKYFDARKKGLNLEDSFAYVFQYAGTAILFTTIIFIGKLC